MKYFNHYFLVTGNYHGSIHVLINLSSMYQSLVQLLEHYRAISCLLNSNLLNILLLGESGPGKRGGAGGPMSLARGLGHGPSNFFKLDRPRLLTGQWT